MQFLNNWQPFIRKLVMGMYIEYSMLNQFRAYFSIPKFYAKSKTIATKYFPQKPGETQKLHINHSKYCFNR